MVKMSVLNDALKNICNAEKAGKRQVCVGPTLPHSFPDKAIVCLWPQKYVKLNSRYLLASM
jgi:hypothetical protein